MKKYISIILVAVVTFLMFTPGSEAAIRIRLGGNRATQTYTQPQYTAPLYTTQTPTYHFYYSASYQPGYTYYATPRAGYYWYGNLSGTQPYGVEQGSYYYSGVPQAGYVYGATPVPGYYLYHGYAYQTSSPVAPQLPTTSNSWNASSPVCIIVRGVYECANSLSTNTYSTYPGCDGSDIVIGGQAWAGCNASDLRQGSSQRSGWFFAGDVQSSFVSANTLGAPLEWAGGQNRQSDFSTGPCAPGYRLPTRGDWETLVRYARANGTSITSLVSLPQNGAYQGVRTSRGDVIVNGRLNVSGAYWAASALGEYPAVMHFGSTYAGYNTNATEYGYVNNGYNWYDTDRGYELVASSAGELANVRCIRR